MQTLESLYPATSKPLKPYEPLALLTSLAQAAPSKLRFGCVQRVFRGPGKSCEPPWPSKCFWKAKIPHFPKESGFLSQGVLPRPSELDLGVSFPWNLLVLRYLPQHI